MDTKINLNRESLDHTRVEPISPDTNKEVKNNKMDLLSTDTLPDNLVFDGDLKHKPPKNEPRDFGLPDGIPINPHNFQIQRYPAQISDETPNPSLPKLGSRFEEVELEDHEEPVPLYNYPSRHISAHETNCTSPNVTKDKNGVCVCLPEHKGDPYSIQGCWRCPIACHGRAECVYPGQCQCQKGFDGDGVLNCNSIVPTIISVSPQICPSSGCLVNITFQYNGPNSLPKEAFCRFGVSNVTGHIKKQSVFCRAPPKSPRIVSVEISFDQELWSEGSFNLEYGDVAFPRLMAILISLFTLSGICAIIYYGVQCRQNDPQERQPFRDDVSWRNMSKRL